MKFVGDKKQKLDDYYVKELHDVRLLFDNQPDLTLKHIFNVAENASYIGSYYPPTQREPRPWRRQEVYYYPTVFEYAESAEVVNKKIEYQSDFDRAYREQPDNK